MSLRRIPSPRMWRKLSVPTLLSFAVALLIQAWWPAWAWVDNADRAALAGADWTICHGGPTDAPLSGDAPAGVATNDGGLARTLGPHVALWSRGSYLVHSLAHCDACHGERGASGSERSGLTLAAAIEPAPPAARPGSRTPARMAPEDDHACVLWGGRIYATACAQCHDHDRGAARRGTLQTPVSAWSDAGDSLQRVVLGGEARRKDPRVVPASALNAAMSEAQVSALVAFLRSHSAAMPSGPDDPRVARDGGS